MSKGKNKLSYTPRRANLVKPDILGVKKVHGFETDWAVLEGESLIGESLAETSAREPLGELPFSRLRHLDHNIIL